MESRIRCSAYSSISSVGATRCWFIAPSAVGANDLDTGDGVRVVRLPSFSVAGYSDIRLAVGGVSRVRRILADFAPDVVHLASPFELGRRAMRAADQLDIPTVAVYQTDVPGYLGKYGLPFLEAWAWQRVIAIHQSATRTLAPSLSAARQLELHGIPRVELWGRGVDTARFHPGKRSAAFRAKAAPNGELLIGLSAASPSRSRWKISSRSPALISSCTPVNSRPFAKQFRRRWHPECRWSRLRGADRSISSTLRAPDGCTPLAISGNFGDTSSI